MTIGRASHQQFRYLPPEPEDEVWGVFLLDAGSATIAPRASYPPAGHPEGYAFQWNQGRVLQEFQIILVRRGRGVLETRAGGRRAVRAGQAFVLFPGEWHRYRPAPGEGWTELWVGFSGDYAAHLMRNFFAPNDPIINVASPREVCDVMTRLVSAAAKWPAGGSRSLLGVGLLEVIAHLRRSRGVAPDPASGARLESARLDILTHASERIHWKDMARRYGLSYASFRRSFKDMTGRSPLDYQIQVRLNRAAELLRQTPLSAREIAERLGYANAHFFSRQFKKRFGKSPQHFREVGKTANGRKFSLME